MDSFNDALLNIFEGLSDNCLYTLECVLLNCLVSLLSSKKSIHNLHSRSWPKKIFNRHLKYSRGSTISSC